MNANQFMDTVTLNQYDRSGLMYCYLLTNTNNNKSYVGITNNPKRRWADHKWSVNDKVCGNNPLYRSIAKNGSDTFDIKIIKQWSDPKFREARTGKNHWASKAVVIFGNRYDTIASAAKAHNKTEGFVKYHACPSKWNNWDPKKHSNSYFVNKEDITQYPFTFIKGICFNKNNQWYILN